MAATSRGRRPGAPDTRTEILDVARLSFSMKGFRATTIRAIAADAGVDPALVHHYFGSKSDLFVAAIALPLDPRQLLAPVVAAGPEGAGQRLVRAMLQAWDDPQMQPPLLALARSVTDGEGGRLMKEGFLPVLIGPTLHALVVDRPEVRVPLVTSQMVGLIVTRYLLVVPGLADMAAEDVVARIGPVIQTYLTGKV